MFRYIKINFPTYLLTVQGFPSADSFTGDGDGETGAGVSGAGEGVDVGDEEGIGSCLTGSDEGGNLGGNDGVSVVALDSD